MLVRRAHHSGIGEARQENDGKVRVVRECRVDQRHAECVGKVYVAEQQSVLLRTQLADGGAAVVRGVHDEATRAQKAAEHVA